jgi:hypothetical protein
MPRRVVAKVSGTLAALSRVGFVVTTGRRLLQSAEQGEQWIKEGRMRQVDAAFMPFVCRQCRTSPAPRAGYNLGNYLRTLATPEPIKDWC